MAAFAVRTTHRFDRLARSHAKHHPEFAKLLEEAVAILASDPHNRTTVHPVRKLTGVRQGDGQYRLRLRRWRFRYDIYDDEIVLLYCGLSREGTYR